MRTLVDTDPKVIVDLIGAYTGRLAFDVGANAGQAARLLMNHFVHVVAWEPCMESYAELSKLGPRVTTSRQAVSAHRGPILLMEAEKSLQTGQLVTGSSLEFSWGAQTGTRQVEATTLDYEAETWGVPDFVKIDTEGHEVEVVIGGLKMLTAHHPKMLVEVHAEAHGPAITSLLPAYRWDKIVHPYYAAGSYGRDNHYFLKGD